MVPCFCPGFLQRAAWASTSLGARGCRGSPQKGSREARFNQKSRSSGMVRWVQGKPGNQSKGQDQGHPQLGTAFVAPQHHSSDGGLKAWAEMGLIGRGLVSGEARQGR